MFRKLKTQLTDTVNEKLKQAAFGDTLSPPKDSQSGRSRLSSFSSITSDTNNSLVAQAAYVSPNRQHQPPSDVESEADLETSINLVSQTETKKLQTLLATYKTKFNQLKNAYAESELEKEKIKNILAKNQDKALRRVQDLKEQIELDRTAKMERELHYKNLLEDKDKTIDKLKVSLEREQSSAKSTASELVNECGEDQQKLTTANDNSNEIIKNMKILMVKYKEIMKSQNEQIKMINDENDRLKSQQHPKVTTSSDNNNDTKRLNDLLSELNEKDTFYKEQIKFMQTGYASEIDNMKINNDELVQNISLLKTKLQSAQDDLTRLNENYTSLFRNFEAKEDDMRALEDKIKSLEADRNECARRVERQNEDKQRDEKDHEDQINELVRMHIHDMAVKDADRDGLMTKIDDLANEVSDLNGKIGCLVAEKAKELETYEEKTKTLVNDLGNVHEISLNTLKTRSDELEGQLEQEKMARCDDIGRLEKAISELTDEKAALNRRIQVLVEDKSEITSKAHIEIQEKVADWNRVKAQLEEENSNLTRKIEVVMANTTKSLDEQTTMLTKKVDVLEADRLKHVKRIDELESKLSQAENELTTRSASINGLDGKIGDLERERVELASRLESLTQNELKQLEAMRQQLTEASDHAKQLEIKCASLESGNFDLSRKIDSLVEECAKHNKTAIEFEQELNKKRDAESKRLEELDQAESEKSQLAERVEALIGEKTKLLEKIESVSNELVQKQARLDDLEMEIGRIEREKCDLNGKLELLTSENATRESISMKTERELREKCEEIMRLEDQLKHAKDVSHTLSEQIERLKEENSKEFTAFQEKLKCLDRLDEVHANEIDEKNANIGRLVTQVHELEAQNSVLSSKIENILAEKAEISSYYEQEKQNTATLKFQIDTTNQTHSNRTVMLENQLADMQETVSKLNDVEVRLADARAQNTVLNADVASMLTKISKLETEIIEKQESICKLNDSLGNPRSLLDAEKETSNSQINAVNAKLGELSVKIENEIEAKNVLNEKLVESSSIIGELRADQQFYLNVLGLVEEKFSFKEHLANKNLAEIENKVRYYFTELAEMRESLKGENEALLKSMSNENSKINDLNSLFEAQKQKLESEIVDLKTALDASTNKCLTLSANEKSLENELCMLKENNIKLAKDSNEKLRSLENVYNELMGKHTGLNKDLIEAHNSIKDWQMKNENLTNELKQCKKNLLMYENDTANLNGQILSLKQEIDNLLGLQDSERSKTELLEKTLNQQLSSLEAKYQDLRNIISDKDRQIADINQKISEKENQAVHLRDVAAKESIKYESLLAEKLNLETELENLNEKYNMIKETTFLKNKRRSEFEKDDTYAKTRSGSSLYKDYKTNKNALDNSATAIFEMHDQEHLIHSNYMTLESTEIDYLRQIIYAYMMGTDPVTMAKVIVAVLKFSEEETRQIIEHEKSKQSTWFTK